MSAMRPDAVLDACPGCGHDKRNHDRDAGGCLSTQDWRYTNDIVCACPLAFDEDVAS